MPRSASPDRLLLIAKRALILAMRLLTVATSLSCSPAALAATLPSPDAIDALAERARLLFDVPGLSLAIVQNGRLVFAKGYGQRDRAGSLAVDPRTVFGIGSISKSFTTAALALLVQEGKLGWDDPVVAHLAHFRLSDPVATRELTVRDLVTHRSGLGAGAGDLMLFSRSRFTREEAVRGARFLALRTRPRSGFAYNNLMFVVAGQLVEAVSGESWERFVQSRLIDPLGLTDCHADPAAFLGEAASRADVAIGYTEIGTALMPLPPDPLVAAAPAGGILCSAADLSRWAAMLLAGGTIGGVHVLDRAQRDALWAPQTILPTAETASLSHQHFRDYAMGWFLEDFDGVMRIWHSGSVAGMVGMVSLLPELDTGIVVLTNQENGNATNGLVAALSQALIGGSGGAPGETPVDWLAAYKARQDAAVARRDRLAASLPGTQARPFLHPAPASLDAYVGRYRDCWRGLFRVVRRGDRLRLSVERAEDLAGTLQALPHDLFVVHWDDRLFNGEDDAFLQFRRGTNGGIAGASMRLVGSDMSFDVRDLDLRRVGTARAQCGAGRAG